MEFWEATFFRFNHFNPTVSDESCRELWLRSWIFTGRSHLSWCMGSGHILIYLCNIFPDKGSTTYKKQSHCRKLRGEQRDHKNDNAFFSNIWQQQQLANAPKARTTIFCIFWPWTCWCSRYHAVIYKMIHTRVINKCISSWELPWIERKEMDSWNPAPPGKNNINHCKISAIVTIYSRQLGLEPYPSIAMLRWLSHHKYIYIHRMIHLSSSTQIIPKNPTRPQDLCSTRHAIAYIPPNKKGFCLGWESVLVFRIMDRWMSLGLCPMPGTQTL